uniref:Wsv423-like protein n=1 Tax=Trachysalambria curvirostris majanivirus TaxID=2984281 RepID=A0A9C7BNC1_9VIRU|nr:MAG: wsv423-like protein [Trachysalambria curvirostris majanivirus]
MGNLFNKTCHSNLPLSLINKRIENKHHLDNCSSLEKDNITIDKLSLKEDIKELYYIYPNLPIYRCRQLLVAQMPRANKYLGIRPQQPLIDVILMQRYSHRIKNWRLLNTLPSYFIGVKHSYPCHEDVIKDRQEVFRSIKRYIKEIKLKKMATVGEDNTQKNYINDKDKIWPIFDYYDVDTIAYNTFVNIRPIEMILSICNKYSYQKSINDLIKIFRLPKDAVKRILKKKSSFLYEIHSQCFIWKKKRSQKGENVPISIPMEHALQTITISPEELFYEIKYGVYFVPSTGTVFKFLDDITKYEDFLFEEFIGLQLGHVKGIVEVTSVYAEAFCLEFPFAGVSLLEVINADHNGLHNLLITRNTGQIEHLGHQFEPNYDYLCIYSVRMLQEMGKMPPKFKDLPHIYDSYQAIGVLNYMRDEMLSSLPFMLAEIANIVTRIIEQGIVNLDIKSDNIVLDSISGQPKIIDFGLALPIRGAGYPHPDINIYNDIYIEYPQSAPEYLNGYPCDEKAMTYSLAYLFFSILSTLNKRTSNQVATCLYTSMIMTDILVRCYSERSEERPLPSEIAKVIGSHYPFKDEIRMLFI